MSRTYSKAIGKNMSPQGIKKLKKKRKRKYAFLRANYPVGSLVSYKFVGRIDSYNIGKIVEHAIVLGYSITKDPHDLPKLVLFNSGGLRSISPNGISLRGGRIKTLQRPYSKVKGIEIV